MTPEERGRQVMRHLHDAGVRHAPLFADEAVRTTVTQAIREAEAAMKERCAKAARELHRRFHGSQTNPGDAILTAEAAIRALK